MPCDFQRHAPNGDVASLIGVTGDVVRHRLDDPCACNQLRSTTCDIVFGTVLNMTVLLAGHDETNADFNDGGRNEYCRTTHDGVGRFDEGSGNRPITQRPT